jgi:hypothetical protein
LDRLDERGALMDLAVIVVLVMIGAFLGFFVVNPDDDGY